MFNRSRNKIIASIMGALVLLFGLTLTIITLASYRDMQMKSREMLDRYVGLYSLDQQPGTQNDAGPEPMMGEPPPDDRHDFQLSTFYSVALAEDGTALAVDNGGKNVYPEAELIRIAREIRAKDQASGKIDDLRYAVRRMDGYTLVAFMDNTVERSSFSSLLHNVLLIGSLAIVIMFFLSLFLSKQIIRPLEENDRKQKQFVSDASHELKTPVAVIGANAEMLTRELGENEWLSNIQYENDRMGELVKQLLELSRAETADAPMAPVDFSRVVTGEVLAFESLAFDRGKAIQSDIEGNISLSGSQTQLAQLVSVLLDNAIRHSTGRDINVSLRQQAHRAVLCVWNEGEEIPAEKRAHLFDRFYRLDEARGGEGYGLGLSIARAITERHGGSIDVACREGTVAFTAALPVRKN